MILTGTVAQWESPETHHTSRHLSRLLPNTATVGIGADPKTSSEQETQHPLVHPYHVTKDVNTESRTGWRLTVKVGEKLVV